MGGKANRYVPSMSAAAVRAKTGKDWNAWFRALDKLGATKLEHREIAKFLSETHGLPGWWCQCVTVEYERARGLRARHETTSGFSVAVSKTIATRVSELYGATTNPVQRKRWFPKGAFEPSSETKNKYFRGSWNKTARLEIGFYAKGAGKAQIAVAVNKLAEKSDVEAQRAVWKKALEKLAAMVQTDAAASAASRRARRK
jgi:hypothetical protein